MLQGDCCRPWCREGRHQGTFGLRQVSLGCVAGAGRGDETSPDPADTEIKSRASAVSLLNEDHRMLALGGRRAITASVAAHSSLLAVWWRSPQVRRRSSAPVGGSSTTVTIARSLGRFEAWQRLTLQRGADPSNPATASSSPRAAKWKSSEAGAAGSGAWWARIVEIDRRERLS